MCSQDLLRMCSDTNATPVLPGIDPPNHEPWGSDSGVAGIYTQWCSRTNQLPWLQGFLQYQPQTATGRLSGFSRLHKPMLRRSLR